MSRFSSLHRSTPTRLILTWLVMAGLLLGAAYLVFELGRIQAGYSLVAAAQERNALEEQIDRLQQDKQELEEQIAMLETHRTIDRESYAVVEQSLSGLQTKIREQQEAIAFYRGIVSPADGKAGLKVQNLNVTRGAAEHEYTIRLVLVQAKKHDRKVSGSVKLSFAGTEDGKQKTYRYIDLVPADSASKWAFSFRYFQDFERAIMLPDGFTPETIIVQVESKTKSIEGIEASYSWLDSLG
ncbi:MAG TPA: hypothetical protein PKK10_08635 [Woeseiaceae bacterium]|nr:hypothetical protein [Woeseiaceae bacterium]